VKTIKNLDPLKDEIGKGPTKSNYYGNCFRCLHLAKQLLHTFFRTFIFSNPRTLLCLER
jgi:hypothetical protein